MEKKFTPNEKKVAPTEKKYSPIEKKFAPTDKKKAYVKPSEAEYKCYSINLHNFLKENGLRTMGEEKHSKTKRTAFIYKKTKELDKLLEQWSNNRK